MPCIVQVVVKQDREHGLFSEMCAGKKQSGREIVVKYAMVFRDGGKD